MTARPDLDAIKAQTQHGDPFVILPREDVLALVAWIEALEDGLRDAANVMHVALGIMRGLEDDPEAVKAAMGKLEYGMYEARALPTPAPR